MTTYEEDMVDVYYNLQDYFTITNIPFSAIEKRKGGKGRGEIDVLAIKVKNNKVIDCVHAEVSVSLTTNFPDLTRTQPAADESNRLIKKFFSNDSEHKIREIIGNTSFKRVLISSDFDKKSLTRLKNRIPDFGGEILNLKMSSEGSIITRIKHDKKTIDLEIIPFKKVLRDIKELFKIKNLQNKNFQDERYRGIHYLIEGSLK